MGETPDCSIDYDRLAALPIALPPALPEASEGWNAEVAWIAEVGLEAAVLHIDHPVEETYDPVLADNRATRSLPIFDSADVVLLPLSGAGRALDNNDPVGVVDDTTLQTPITPSQLDAVAPKVFHKVSAETAEAFEDRVQAQHLWDDDARKVSGLPIPQVMNESILLLWPDRVRVDQPFLDAPLNLDTALGPAYLLPTEGATLEGELDPFWLRAPMTGRFRFERYQHLVRNTTTGDLSLRRPSRTGRVVVRASPLAGVPSESSGNGIEDKSPLHKELYFAFEHVDPVATGICIANQLRDHTKRFDELMNSERFSKDRGFLVNNGGLIDEVAWAIRTWLALMDRKDLGHVQGASPIGLSLDMTMRQALRAELPANSSRNSSKATLDATNLIVGSADALGEFDQFLSFYYGPLLTGVTWGELGINVAVDADGYDDEAHGELLSALRLSGGWVVCYAGCPLGKPTRVYRTSTTGTSARDTWFGGWTTFHAEALYQAGHPSGTASDPIRDHGLARSAGPASLGAVHSYMSDQVSAYPVGYFAIFRILDRKPNLRDFTTEDWLQEVLCGTSRKTKQEPLINFASLANAGHVAAPLVNWDKYLLGLRARARLDVLNDAEVSGIPLMTRSINWWRDNTAYTVDNMWIDAFGYPIVPKPETPYKKFRVTNDGFDTYHSTPFDQVDLRYAILAASMLRDGKGLGQSLNPAVILALAEAEGYKLYGRDRLATLSEYPYPWVNPDHLTHRRDCSSTVRADPYALRTITRRWWADINGLDILNRPRHPVYGGDTWPILDDYKVLAHERFNISMDHIEQPGPLAPMEPILPITSRYHGDLDRYLLDRMTAHFMTVGNVVSDDDLLYMAKCSRRVNFVTMLMLGAQFELHHRGLHLKEMYDKTPVTGEVGVPELTAASLPALGADANSLERRAYIAYYGTVYLAFNAHPNIVTRWFNLLRSARDSTTETVQLFFGAFPSRYGPMAVDPVDGILKATVEDRAMGSAHRFCAALDAYLRMNIDGTGLLGDDINLDVTDPNARTWRTP